MDSIRRSVCQLCPKGRAGLVAADGDATGFVPVRLGPGLPALLRGIARTGAVPLGRGQAKEGAVQRPRRPPGARLEPGRSSPGSGMVPTGVSGVARPGVRDLLPTFCSRDDQ